MASQAAPFSASTSSLPSLGTSSSSSPRRRLPSEKWPRADQNAVSLLARRRAEAESSRPYQSSAARRLSCSSSSRSSRDLSGQHGGRAKSLASFQNAAAWAAWTAAAHDRSASRSAANWRTLSNMTYLGAAPDLASGRSRL